jgi:membrane peptidoglycan carboxypeptidase
MAGLWFYINLIRDLPSIDVLPSLSEPPSGTLLQPTRLYDRTREHVILTLENPAAAGKQYLKVGKDAQEGANQISKYLVDATIAELDPNFWNHNGYTLTGLSEGVHSTLAQMLIYNLILKDEPPSLRRNIRERMLAAQVTAKFGREKILEWYLNTAQYGDLIYSADAAARVFFGKSATKLSLAEAAMLTALSESPGINRLTGLQSLKKQQELIIDKMLVEGFVNADEARMALKEDLQYQDQIEPQSMAPKFTELVLKQLSSALPLERLSRGGYEIITTLDYGLQLQAACTSDVQIARIRGTAEPTVTFDGSPCEADQLLPTRESSAEKSINDISAEVVVLDSHSGQILSLVGEGGSGMNASYPILHPAGSIVSPFLYLTAFTRGMSPATMLWDIPNMNGSDSTPPPQIDLNKALSITYHGPVSLRNAFVNDYQGAASEVLQQVGPENVWLTEQQFGISTPDNTISTETKLENFYSQQITLLGAVQAYSVLANQGMMSGQPDIEKTPGKTQKGLSPTSILRVMGVDGKVWLDWTNQQDLSIVTPEITYLTTSILSDEKARWPTLGHPNLLEIGRPTGAKVSLTADANNAWAVGYIPQLAIGVWMGHSQGDAGGITVDMPAGLWHALMQYTSKEMPVQDFTPPPGINRVQVCDPSGLLVSPLCQTIVQEVFLSGNEPTQTDDLYQKVYIDRQTGLLATIFTPSELVDEKVYLVFPPQAIAWAKETGLAIPPDTYDSVSFPPPSSENVKFLNLKMFDFVGGKVSIIGSAGGDNFAYYRIQVGQGLYPQNWLQIGEDVHQPVMDGLIGTWDTQGLEGLYVVELMVVKQDLRIERAILQVTIDNTPPDVKILTPKNNEQFAYEQGKDILMDVSVSDNQAVQRVEYYVDNQLASTLYEPPFFILWDAQLGEHILQVKAYDLAGNQNNTNVSFFCNQIKEKDWVIPIKSPSLFLFYKRLKVNVESTPHLINDISVSRFDCYLDQDNLGGRVNNIHST